MPVVLTTDGGPHSAETWALASAEQLFLSMIPAGTLRPLELQAAELRVAADLVAIYAQVQDDERNRLTNGIADDFHTDPYLNDIVNVVKVAVAGTKYKDHFDKQETINWVQTMCSQHIIDMQHVERLWHKDKGENN